MRSIKDDLFLDSVGGDHCSFLSCCEANKTQLSRYKNNLIASILNFQTEWLKFHIPSQWVSLLLQLAPWRETWQYNALDENHRRLQEVGLAV